MSRTLFPALALAASLSAAPALAASVSTAWATLPSDDQEQCLSIGMQVLQNVGFRANISQDRQTVFGWRGEEALTVRCISGRGIAVVFAWVTDQANDSGALVEAVVQAYRNPSPPPQAGTFGGGGGNLGGGGGGFGGGGGGFGGAPGGIVKR